MSFCDLITHFDPSAALGVIVSSWKTLLEILFSWFPLFVNARRLEIMRLLQCSSSHHHHHHHKVIRKSTAT